jgi:prepilin-type N-terminal cleavage/methylation domain-containing protein
MKTRRQGATREGFSAFTLIELLITMTILAILIALTLPTLARTLEHAQAARSTNNLRQLVTANLSYAADNGVYCPASNNSLDKLWCGAWPSANGTFDPTQGYLSDYLGKSRRIMVCPLFKDMIKGSASFEDGTGGYGYNASHVGGIPAGGYNADGSRVSARVTGIQRANTVMFTTAAKANGSDIQEWPFCEPPYWDLGDGSLQTRPSPTVHFRFNNKALVGWCDGRVTAEACDPREVGYNPLGGDPKAQKLGWFGPDEENGFWNPERTGP